MKKEFYNAYKPRRILKKFTLIAVLLLILAVIFVGICFYTDYLEVKEIGEQFVSVFTKNLIYKTIFSVIYFLISFFLIYLFTNIIKKNLINASADPGFLGRKSAVLILCAAVALFASNYMASNLYESFLMYQNSVPFNMNDPILNMDISYYLFQRPFIKMFLDSISATLLFILIYSIVVYLMLYIRIGERNINDLLTNKQIMSHITTTLLILMVIKGISVWIDAQGLLTGQFTDLTGAGFVDVNITLNFYRFAPFIILAITIVALVFLVKKKYLKAVISCASYFALIILINIIGWGVQLLYVSPNEVAAESEYIQHNIDFTRFSYNLSNVEEYECAVSENPTLESSNLTQDVVDNIRIIDFPATVTATNQLQGIRSYYYFHDMDVGVYNINGKKEAVAIGAREISKKNMEDTAKNYINEKFRFTHGYGVAMAKINSVTEKGQPEYLIENLASAMKEGVPDVKQPRIYFGQLTDDSVIVNTKVRELDYSEGTKDIEFDYDGPAGIKLNFWNKLLFAFKSGDFRMLIANQITSESRLLLNRNILDRVQKVAPFFKYDTDPVIVIDDDGSLKWVIDGYTTSSQMPYSQYTNGYNYIRNSFKVTIDAYTGEVAFYVIDNDDPIINVYQKIYPKLFSGEPISQSIIEKSKYPEALFNIQCKIYAQYHVTNPSIFYNKNDIYAIANEKYTKDIKPIEPYYNIMQLDAFNENEAEMILMLPFTLINRENMVSWIAVGNEGDNYGKIIAYKFPKDYTVYGPLQIENMIDNDPEISKEMTLWSSGGSDVIRGNLLVIPIKDTILYVEPVYISSDNQATLPLLKRVIVGCGDNIVMAESLEKALEQLFNYKNVGTPTEMPDNSTEEPVIQLNDDSVSAISEAYNRVENASKNGDWVEFGKAMNDLKGLISDLSVKSE